MKAIINSIVTGIKGNAPKHNSNLGRVTVSIEGASNGSISIDAFDGQGETYKRRTDAEITIRLGEVCFEGTLTELAYRLVEQQKALKRIVDFYDNTEDLAGVIARNVLENSK